MSVILFVHESGVAVQKAAYLDHHLLCRIVVHSCRMQLLTVQFSPIVNTEPEKHTTGPLAAEQSTANRQGSKTSAKTANQEIPRKQKHPGVYTRNLTEVRGRVPQSGIPDHSTCAGRLAEFWKVPGTLTGSRRDTRSIDAKRGSPPGSHCARRAGRLGLSVLRSSVEGMQENAKAKAKTQCSTGDTQIKTPDDTTRQGNDPQPGLQYLLR
jgi:hypothetical protein